MNEQDVARCSKLFYNVLDTLWLLIVMTFDSVELYIEKLLKILSNYKLRDFIDY